MNKNKHVGLRRQLKEAKAILAKDYVPFDCSPPCTQENAEENFPEVVLFAAFSVTKCHSCKGQIIKKVASHPKIWFFACRLFEYGDQIHRHSGKDITEMFIFT